MSRIFAITTLSIVLLAGTAMISVAYDNSSAQSEQLDGIVELFATGLDAAVVLPIALGVGLLLACLGVLARA